MFPMIVLAAALLRGPVVQPTLPITATVAEWSWVDIVNPGVPEGETCGIQFGNTVELIGRSGARVLVRYLGSETAGTPCDGEELFFLDVKDYKSMTKRYEAEVTRRTRQKAEVERLLHEGRSVHPRVQFVPEWSWVDIVNPGVPYGEVCGTNPGAKVYEIAHTTDGRVLVSYDPNGTQTAGTPCDGNEIFFLWEADFVTMTDRYNGLSQEGEDEAAIVERLLEEEGRKSLVDKLKRFLP